MTRAEAAKDFPSALEAGEAALWGEPLHLVIRTGDGAIRVNRATLAENDQILSGKEVVHAIASRKDVVLD